MLPGQYRLLEYCTRQKLTEGKKKKKGLWEDQKEKLEHKVANCRSWKKKGFLSIMTISYNKQFKGAFSSWNSSKGLFWLSFRRSRKER